MNCSGTGMPVVRLVILFTLFKLMMLMKNFLFIAVLLVAGFYWFAFSKPPAVRSASSNPAIILLQDSRLPVTIQCTYDGSAWQAPAGAAGAYFSQILAGFGQMGIGNFQNIRVKFNDDFTAGSLQGSGTGPNGAKVPVGIEYAFQSREGDTILMLSTDKHSCEGNPCSCCEFVEDSGGKIKGCKCLGDNDCHLTGNDKCDHRVER